MSLQQQEIHIEMENTTSPQAPVAQSTNDKSTNTVNTAVISNPQHIDINKYRLEILGFLTGLMVASYKNEGNAKMIAYGLLGVVGVYAFSLAYPEKANQLRSKL